MTTKGRPLLPDSDRADSHLHIRVTARQKAAWVKAAQKRGQKLAPWVIESLDKQLAKSGE